MCCVILLLEAKLQSIQSQIMNCLLCFYFINTDQNKPNTYMMEYHVTEKYANKDYWVPMKNVCQLHTAQCCCFFLLTFCLTLPKTKDNLVDTLFLYLFLYIFKYR